MKHKQSQQSGFTPTLTFKQSIVRFFKYRMSSIFIFDRYTNVRRGQSPQLKSQCQGFSLVETLVAITILLIVVTGPMTIITSTSRSTSFASEQVVAFFLAQEGAEIAQKVRDDELIDYFNTGGAQVANPWTDVMNNPGGILEDCFDPAGCSLELKTNANATLEPTTVCNGVAGCKLYYNENGDRSTYTYDAGGGNIDTGYKRKIYLQMSPSGQEVEVRSVVEWRTGFLRDLQSVEVQTFLFDIYDT